jgi:hypothetical protein
MASIAQNKNAFVYQIFYDQESSRYLDPGFIPLDNTANKRPDWYEFWVIRNFLKKNVLRENAWYGFLSPKFREKSGFDSTVVLSILDQCDAHCDVALFSGGWDQLAYFANPFEQGEVWHPGLTRLSQYFLDQIGMKVDLTKLVTYSDTSLFSNYIVAKPKFWNQWLEIADKFFEFVEHGNASEFRKDTTYGSEVYQVPIKTFIQERFASVILAQGGFKVASLDQNQIGPIDPLIFKEYAQTRKMLQTCDILKEKYCRTNDDDYLKMYYKIRKGIEVISH